MELFFIVFCVLALIVGMMSIGIILGKKPIAGSCGGMSALGMDVVCDVCKGDKSKCDSEIKRVQPSNVDLQSFSYNAMKD